MLSGGGGTPHPLPEAAEEGISMPQLPAENSQG